MFRIIVIVPEGNINATTPMDVAIVREAKDGTTLEIVHRESGVPVNYLTFKRFEVLRAEKEKRSFHQ